MPTISEPQAEVRNQSYKTLREHFIAGRIGEATFRASLRILGLCPMDVTAETNLAKMEKRPARQM